MGGLLPEVQGKISNNPKTPGGDVKPFPWERKLEGSLPEVEEADIHKGCKPVPYFWRHVSTTIKDKI